MKKTTIISIAAIILVIGGAIWIARPDSQTSTVSSTRSNGTLIVEEASNYDFGAISMSAGKVKHQFKIKNTGNGEVIINKMYTSCMCTTASLMMAGKQFGPYGMSGHSAILKIGQVINPNEEAIIEVVFDPGAHGPEGTGKVKRLIYLETNSEITPKLQLTIEAEVIK